VASVDINPAANAISANDALGSAGAEGLTPPPVTPQEKQQIMDMFESK